MAFFEGVLAGYGIAIPVGAIAILIIDRALREGFRVGFMAGAGAASADLIYALLAAIAGQAITTWLEPWSFWLGVLSGIVLIAMGIYALWRLRFPVAVAESDNKRPSRLGNTYLQFLGLTILNPMTIAYFGSLILGGAADSIHTFDDRLFFVAGAVLASLSWQTMLAAFGSLAHRRLSPRWQKFLSLLGAVIVLSFGIKILINLF